MVEHRYNELVYAEEIFKNGFQSTFLRYELVVLVKYLKHLEYSKKDTERFLYSFCKKHIIGFNEVKYYRVIDGAIRDGRKKKNPLIIVQDIPIWINELEYIDSLNIDNEHKKLLLSFLVKKKISLEIHKLINNDATISIYFEGSRKKFKEIFDCANITGKYKVDFMVNDLVNKDIVTSTYDGNIILDFIQEIEVVDKADGVYHLLQPCDFENIGLIFDCYKGINKVTKCEVCGKIIKGKGKKNNKYCEKCAKEKIKERDRKRKELLRKNENIGK